MMTGPGFFSGASFENSSVARQRASVSRRPLCSSRAAWRSFSFGRAGGCWTTWSRSCGMRGPGDATSAPRSRRGPRRLRPRNPNAMCISFEVLALSVPVLQARRHHLEVVLAVRHLEAHPVPVEPDLPVAVQPDRRPRAVAGLPAVHFRADHVGPRIRGAALGEDARVRTERKADHGLHVQALGLLLPAVGELRLAEVHVSDLETEPIAE